MNGRCPKCGETHNVRVGRGDKLSNHDCPACGVALRGVASGRGRYLCPVDGFVVTLGQTAVQLDRPMVLSWQPGTFGRWHVSEPSELDAQCLQRLAGRILGTGCVVSAHYDPDRDRPKGWTEQAGLRLIDADDPGDPTAWLVNERLVYRPCTACTSRIPDLPDHHVPSAWTPRRAWATKGRGQYRRAQVAVDQGPHPAGSLACPDCDPRRRTAGR
ncbi:hypothetical protein ACFV2H_48720 [Streptomyces sp. NPDC059629]|uniref:hypothetical protein n=1 Tax=Streptomyces sp. NPDC059629 TaxID=3346889 RepID=UPI0036C3348C